MKDFCEMTADEIQSHRETGEPVYSYAFSAVAPGRNRPTYFDGDHTTLDVAIVTCGKIQRGLAGRGYTSITDASIFRRA